MDNEVLNCITKSSLIYNIWKSVLKYPKRRKNKECKFTSAVSVVACSVYLIAMSALSAHLLVSPLQKVPVNNIPIKNNDTHISCNIVYFSVLNEYQYGLHPHTVPKTELRNLAKFSLMKKQLIYCMQFLSCFLNRKRNLPAERS